MKKIEKEQYREISKAILATSEVNAFEKKFDQYCERKIIELEDGGFLVSRKPLAITTEPGWDKIKFYKETRKRPDGTVYVRKIKLMMSIGGLSDFEVIIEE